ncbi:transcriptional regulator [Hirsutella rhossiliensis]|uniref:Transcriptional regulator Medusa n=1 Tax=Hirsutella rhossiliensis TaxID=111463 RepID=A0A9P8N3M3_9HYPO|nr:transcriptional regulator Medusa [Hirsutella rhossiliensis]KAH0967733.1 transcriptional regulator Medusa [Hirsutella rhossiliensis]
MSAVKFQSPSYKLFEPVYQTQKPIIVGVDNRLESPDTLTLKYEEAARAANGGDPRGDSPPTVLDMATYGKAQLPSMHGYDSTRYQDAGYGEYPAPSFSAQQSDKFAQLNQQSFASNNAVAQYMPTGPTVLSCHPTSGTFGTKVYLKFSSQYDLFSMSSPMPYVFLSFGSEKCAIQDVTREAQDSSGFVYSCSADAPQLMVTGCSSNTAPLSLVIEGPSVEEISRTVAGSFQYLEGSGDEITRTTKMPKHDTSAPGPQVDQPSVSPKAVDGHLSSDAATNSYDYPSQQSQYAPDFQQGNGDMISTYRSTSFTDPHYHHRRPAPGWSGFGATLGSGRPSLTPLPMPSSTSSGTPQLIRTSTIANGAGSNGPYHPISLYSSKAVLKINGKLDTMAENWTQEEWDNRRRIVMFRKSQTGSSLTASFRAVPVNDRPPNSICISCIWWAEKQECFVTSVDTIHLLEQLVAAPNRFSVEEKNRIRRNLEGFHPMTVSKAKADSEEFFKIIMGFPNPKPRNIEKDVKVFPWKILEPALKKIIGKYSASPSSTLPPANMMTTSQYSVHSSQHESIPSPRSLSGSQASWTPYTTGPTYSAAATRTLSPNIRHTSPQQQPQAPPMRINTTPLPAVTTYDTRTVSTGGYGSSGLHTPISHHPSTATPPRWDTASASYPDSYPSLASHHPSTSQSVYGATTYGDGAPRA